MNLAARAARSYHAFFFAPRPVSGTYYFRHFLALWSLFYYAPRLLYADELFLRTLLREGAFFYQRMGQPMPPAFAVWGALLTIYTALVVVLLSDKWARLAHALMIPAMIYLFAVDGLMARAYGELAIVQWCLFFAAPYDRLRDDTGQIIQAPRFGTRLVQLQLSMVYVCTACSKFFDGVGWAEGWALKNIFLNSRYGDHLLSTIHLPNWGYKWLGWATLCTEVFLAFALWFRLTRKVAFVILITMHTTMIFSLKVSVLFHLLMMGHTLLFFPDEWWTRLQRFVAQRRGAGPSADDDAEPE